MDGREDIFEDYMGDTSRAGMYGDEYVRGWADSDEAIHHRHTGAMSYSQGETDWDKGWNARIDRETLVLRLLTMLLMLLTMLLLMLMLLLLLMQSVSYTQ